MRPFNVVRVAKHHLQNDLMLKPQTCCWNVILPSNVVAFVGHRIKQQYGAEYLKTRFWKILPLHCCQASSNTIWRKHVMKVSEQWLSRTISDERSRTQVSGKMKNISTFNIEGAQATMSQNNLLNLLGMSDIFWRGLAKQKITTPIKESAKNEAHNLTEVVVPT